jgi:cytochrome P450
MAASALRSLLLPGQRGYPIIGETGDWARDPLLFARDRHARYLPVWRTHLLGRPCVLLLGPRGRAEVARCYDLFHTFTRGLFAPLAWRLPWLPYGKAWRAGQALRRMLLRIVREHRPAPGETILGLMIEARDEQGVGFTNEELIDELLVLLWASHDTITALLTWVCHELVWHPEVERQARDEQGPIT